MIGVRGQSLSNFNAARTRSVLDRPLHVTGSCCARDRTVLVVRRTELVDKERPGWSNRYLCSGHAGRRQ